MSTNYCRLAGSFRSCQRASYFLVKEPRAIALGAVCGIAGFLVALFIFWWPGRLPPN